MTGNDADRPLAVGDVLHGFCEGVFGRDHYNCTRIEAVGPDWIVTRSLERSYPGGTGVELASGAESLRKLRRFRTRIRDRYADKPDAYCCTEDSGDTPLTTYRSDHH